MIAPTYLSSSNLDCVGFQLGKLYVRFKSGACYMYETVPYTIFSALAAVESAGSYFHRAVKSNKAIHYTKLESDPFAR
jgi:hypothetical protein